MGGHSPAHPKVSPECNSPTTALGPIHTTATAGGAGRERASPREQGALPCQALPPAAPPAPSEGVQSGNTLMWAKPNGQGGFRVAALSGQGSLGGGRCLPTRTAQCARPRERRRGQQWGPTPRAG